MNAAATDEAIPIAAARTKRDIPQDGRAQIRVPIPPQPPRAPFLRLFSVARAGNLSPIRASFQGATLSSIPNQLPAYQIPPPAPAPSYTLFDANAVTLATFFGTPAAGATLMLVNERRLGHPGRGLVTLLVAIVITALVVLAGWNIPQGASSVFAIAMIVGMKFVANSLQGAAVKIHLQQGGSLGSKWTAFWVGMAYLVVIFVAVFAAVFIPGYMANNGPKVVVGTKDEVYYSGSATQADALALGNALKADGYFTDKGVTVLLEKGANGPVVSFVVKEGIWNQPDMVSSFDEIGREIAPSIGGFPIQLHLVNKAREVKKESTVGKVSVGNDHIYYLGEATQSQAQALGDALKSASFFVGKGSDVFLTKQTDGTSLAFVVGDGVWDDAALVASFEKIAREAAPAVGGLPIKLRLENTTLEVKKDEALN